MTTSVGLRASWLAGVALLALVLALAIKHHREHGAALPAPAGGYATALAAPYTPSAKDRKSACGVEIGPTTAGVGHPVLPCGVKLFIRFDGKQVLTQVIDHAHAVPGRLFDVTPALAKTLGLQGTQTIQWRFAR